MGRRASSSCPLVSLFKSSSKAVKFILLPNALLLPAKHVQHTSPRPFLKSLGQELYNGFSTSPWEFVQVHDPLSSPKQKVPAGNDKITSLKKTPFLLTSGSQSCCTLDKELRKIPHAWLALSADTNSLGRHRHVCLKSLCLNSANSQD